MADNPSIQQKTMPWRQQSFSWYEAGQGHPLVLLHGGGGTGKAWSLQMARLSRRWRVIAPDLPGFGQSPWVEGVNSVDAIAPVLLEWMENMGLERYVLGGNSMGGRVAMAAASLAPHRISGLIILDSVGLSLPDVPITNPLTLPPDQFMSGLVYDAEAYRRVTPYRTLQDAQELNRGRQSFARYLNTAPIGPGPSIKLDRLTMPTLLIWGRLDRIIPLEYGRALARELAHAELMVVDECGHLPHIEQATIVNNAIAHFMDTLSASSG